MRHEDPGIELIVQKVIDSWEGKPDEQVYGEMQLLTQWYNGVLRRLKEKHSAVYDRLVAKPSMVTPTYADGLALNEVMFTALSNPDDPLNAEAMAAINDYTRMQIVGDRTSEFMKRLTERMDAISNEEMQAMAELKNFDRLGGVNPREEGDTNAKEN